MKNTYIELIKENQLLNLPEVRAREFVFQEVPQTALVLIGIRRAGKTMIAKQIAQNLMAQQVTSEQIIYLNFFDERLNSSTASDLSSILEAFYQLFPAVSKKTKKYFFFDEIQVIPGWESFVSRLLTDKNHHVYLTGSSAHLLSKEISTEMRGRAVSYEIFPLSFREYSQWRGFPISNHTAHERGLLSAAFKDYCASGGFPAAFGLQRSTTIRLLQEYYSVAIYKDVIERNEAKKPLLVAALAKLLLNQTGSLYTLNRLAKKLIAQGFKTNSAEVAEYISWLEDAYLVYSVPLYAESEQKKRVNPQKVYCVDHALSSAVSSGVSSNQGHLLENIIFIELRRRFKKIFYYKTADNYEVDFAYKDHENRLVLVQVCHDLSDLETRERQIRGLVAAVRELKADKAYIISDTINVFRHEKQAEVEILPAYQFLIQ